MNCARMSPSIRLAKWLKWHLGPLSGARIVGYFVMPLHNWSIRAVDDWHARREMGIP